MRPSGPADDGECCYDGCPKRVDWKKHDKPPIGWATVTINRYTKKGGVASRTLLVCPEHTISVSKRQLGLALAKPVTAVEPSIVDVEPKEAQETHIHSFEWEKRK